MRRDRSLPPVLALGVVLAACAGPTTPVDDSDADASTWHQDVAPVVRARCGACHTDGGVGPHDLDDYETARALAPLLLEEVRSGRMPPFLAQETDECQPRAGWVDDPRPTDAEIALLAAWVDAGAPQGDPATAAPLPELPSTDLPGANLVLELPEVQLDPSLSDEHLCVVVDPELIGDRYLTGVQVIPGDPEVVHHVLVWADPDDRSAELAGDDGIYPCFGAPGFWPARLIGGYAPGSPPMEMPDEVAVALTAGTKLVVNVHYHATRDEPQRDASKIALRFVEERPTMLGEWLPLGNVGGDWGAFGGLQPGPNDRDGVEFRIPAGAVGHTETIVLTDDSSPTGLPIWGVAPHMHYLGVDMRIAIRRHDTGEEECLVQTPRWDFGWQRTYVYDAPITEVPVWRPGDSLVLRCTYDNTMDNPAVAAALAEAGLDAPVDVALGEGTLDEMCLGVIGVAYPAFGWF